MDVDASRTKGCVPARACLHCDCLFVDNDQHVCLGKQGMHIERFMYRTTINCKNRLLSQSAALALSEPADMECPPNHLCSTRGTTWSKQRNWRIFRTPRVLARLVVPPGNVNKGLQTILDLTGHLDTSSDWTFVESPV